MACTQLNHLHDDVLHLVIKYGNIEDVVSKERVSKRFQIGVSTCLSKMKKINTETDFFKCHLNYDHLVLNVLRRMSNLVDGEEFEYWGEEMVKELAIFNQSIYNWGSDDDRHESRMLIYIEAVRKIDPNYDANQLKFGFWIRYSASNEGIRRLHNTYPNLQLKFNASFRYLHNLTDFERNHCIALSIMEQDPFNYPIINSFNYSSVRQVRIWCTKGMSRDMTIFPNLGHLDISTEDQLNLKEWKLPSKLTSLRIGSDKPWGLADNDAMKQIVDNYSLTDLTILLDDCDIVDVLLNSSNTSIQHVTLDQFDVLNEQMELSPPFMEREVMKRLLLRFKNVTTITMPCGYEDDIQCIELFDMLKEVFLEIEQVQRRRFFKHVLIFE